MKRSHFSHINLQLLEQNSKTSEQQLDKFGEFIRPDEEDVNFMSDLYQMHAVSDDELRQNWRVYTAMNSNDDDANLRARRLENAAWRLQVMRNKRSKSFENLQNIRSQRPSLSTLLLRFQPFSVYQTRWIPSIPH